MERAAVTSRRYDMFMPESPSSRTDTIWAVQIIPEASTAACPLTLDWMKVVVSSSQEQAYDKRFHMSNPPIRPHKDHRREFQLQI